MEFFRRLIRRFNGFLLKFKRSARQETTEGESANIDSVPNEVLLMIFRFLCHEQLLIAEQVCLRWKSVVSTCFATATHLRLYPWWREGGGATVLEQMKLYGPSLKSLELDWCDDVNVDWINEIGDAFPNLLSLSVYSIKLVSGSSSVLPVKCCQLTKISFEECGLNDASIGIILKGFPGLKCLKLIDFDIIYGECFRELGTNIEHLSLTCDKVTPAGTLHIFSICRKLHTLKISSKFECDAHVFSMFCEKSVESLRKLKFQHLTSSKEMFLPISRLSLLEKLKLIGCPCVDSDVLIAISRGCPNLKDVGLEELPLVRDHGVKAIAQCRHLTRLQLNGLDAVTDESLFELAKAGTLKSLIMMYQSNSDRGVSAILAQCPHLKYLYVVNCPGLGDGTVDAAIQAVESRRRLSATLDQSPHGSSTAIVPSFKNPYYLLTLYMSGVALRRYKDGIYIHPHMDPLLYMRLKSVAI